MSMQTLIWPNDVYGPLTRSVVIHHFQSEHHIRWHRFFLYPPYPRSTKLVSLKLRYSLETDLYIIAVAATTRRFSDADRFVV
jgi:hypothetical protein